MAAVVTPCPNNAAGMQRSAHDTSARRPGSSKAVRFTQSSLAASDERAPTIPTGIDTGAGGSQGRGRISTRTDTAQGAGGSAVGRLAWEASPAGVTANHEPPMQNPDIARLFDEVADLLEIQDANPFRVRAYRNAARTIRDFPEPLTDLVRAGAQDLTEIAGIGDDLAEKITEIVTTGELGLRRQLAKKLPAGLLDLLRIPGLGPKRVKLLYKKLKVKSAGD